MCPGRAGWYPLVIGLADERPKSRQPSPDDPWSFLTRTLARLDRAPLATGRGEAFFEREVHQLLSQSKMDFHIALSNAMP